MNDFEKKVINETFAGRKLAANWHKPLGEFLTQEISAINPADDSNVYFQIVIDAMRQRTSRDERALVTTAFPRLPILQMADGSHLLTDPEVYLNNTVMRIGQLYKGSGVVISQQCSTISCITHASEKRGPAFATWDNEVYQVFNSSQNILKHSTPATLHDIDVSLASINGGGLLPIKRLEEFVGTSFASGSQAIRRMNLELWPHDTPLILYDEELTADVVASAIEKTELGDELTDSERLAELKQAKHDAVSHPRNLTLRNTTDFFYAVNRKGRLIPVEADGNHLVTKSDGAVVTELSTHALSEALRDRRLYPDLTLAYACLCLRSGIAAAGGLSQQEYLPRISEVFQGTEEPGIDASILVSGIVELTPQTKELAQKSLIDPTVRRRLDQALATASVQQHVGNMGNFSYFKHLFERREA